MDQQIKPNTGFAVFGMKSVGKSTIIHQLHSYYKNREWNFSQEILPTIGLQYCSFDMEINDKIFTVNAYDMAGGDEPTSITSSLLHNIKGIIFVFDVASKDTLTSLNEYINKVIDKIDINQKDFKYAIFANKIDLTKREVSEEEGSEFAKKHNAMYQEVSAKTGLNLDYAFERFAKELEPNERNNLNPVNEQRSCCLF